MFHFLLQGGFDSGKMRTWPVSAATSLLPACFVHLLSSPVVCTSGRSVAAASNSEGTSFLDATLNAVVERNRKVTTDITVEVALKRSGAEMIGLDKLEG